jgi:hypothetical protein
MSNLEQGARANSVNLRTSESERTEARLSSAAGSLADESEASGDFIVFNASGNSLGIVVRATSELLSATVIHPGQARVPYAVFCGIADSAVPSRKCDRNFVVAWVFQNRSYRLPTSKHLRSGFPQKGEAIVRTKPAKLQNL